MKWIALVLAMTTTSSWGSIYSPYYLWDKQELTTCFAPGDNFERNDGTFVLKFRDWKKSNKEKIKKWVQSEYSLERTGIHFVGFHDCEENPIVDVAIFYNQNSKIETHLFGGLDGLASLGTTLQLRGNRFIGYPLIKGYTVISKSGMDKGTVIHEFGHVAGLYHEHEHPDALRVEPDCKHTHEWAQEISSFNYEPYDMDSVMNYCKLDKTGGRKAGLSPRDVDLLKRLYPN